MDASKSFDPFRHLMAQANQARSRAAEQAWERMVGQCQHCTLLVSRSITAGSYPRIQITRESCGRATCPIDGTLQSAYDQGELAGKFDLLLQVHEILAELGKNKTQIRLDEGLRKRWVPDPESP